MQEVINFDKTKDVAEEYNIPKEINEVYFSPSNVFLNDLDTFNDRYNTVLTVQNASKWSVGTYNIIKEMLMNQMFSHWNTKNGANAVHKFRKYNAWRYDQCVTDLEKLNTKLYELRKANIKLFDDDNKVEGRDWINIFNKKIQKSLSKIDAFIEYTNYPYYNRGNGFHQYLPIVYDTDCSIEDYLGDLPTSAPDKPITWADVDHTLPRNWFFNIMIPLKDISINVYNGKNDLVSSFPYGDLVVGFSIKLSDLFRLNLLAHDTSKFSQLLHKTRSLANFTYKFPNWSAIRHPFVYRSQTGRDENHIARRDFRAYDLGNTCFGDFKIELLQQLCLGNLSIVKTILLNWASNFRLNNTSPLNNLQYAHFGIDRLAESNSIVADYGVCKAQLVNSSKEYKQYFAEENCTPCVLRPRCPVNKRIALSFHEWNHSQEDLDKLGRWKDLYEYIALQCTNYEEVLDALKIRNIGVGDYKEYEYTKVLIPTEWEDNQLSVDFFIDHMIPMAERIYAFHLIQQQNETSWSLQLENKDTDQEKSTEQLIKLANALLLSNGGLHQFSLNQFYRDHYIGDDSQITESGF